MLLHFLHAGQSMAFEHSDFGAIVWPTEALGPGHRFAIPG